MTEIPTRENQWTDFYMIGTSVIKELGFFFLISEDLIKFSEEIFYQKHHFLCSGVI